ncbi:hypothetical protein HYV83_01815 [Candidatus Woesearchaeota archaeon]|nr:hypothetical protein [Candidatus Woesearchaeota archaeon]
MAQSKLALKAVKKKWLTIRASKFFDSELLGECYVASPDLLMGRTVAANLANLTGDIRQQSVTLKFIVNSIDGESGVADVIGYETASSAIRRIVRRGSDRLDESFVCETSNSQKVRIKPVVITKTITNSAVHRSLRKALVSTVVKLVKKHTFESLINEMITSKLQMAVKTDLKRIYPLKSVEITSLWLLRGGEGSEKGTANAAGAAAETEINEGKAASAEQSEQANTAPEAESA